MKYQYDSQTDKQSEHYEDVNYWDEITTIFDWARTHVTSTLYICWAAQAGLYHFYGVPDVYKRQIFC